MKPSIGFRVSLTCKRIPQGEAALAAAFVLVSSAWLAGCGGGNGRQTPPPPETAPSGLSYGAASISAHVNQAITNDVPTVTGTVTSYTVSPALPTGLSLSSSTGVISGTPTIVTAQKQYTITASNTVGSTAAALTIQVLGSANAPNALMYSATTIVATVGTAIVPDLPASSGGAIASYTVTPALPAGLTLNASTGVISGTPTTTADAATYVVDGANAAGTVTATVSPTISVVAAPASLLQLGNQYGVTNLQLSNGRVLSQDASGFWILWNYTSGAEIASGDAEYGGQIVPGISPLAELAGPTLAVGIPGGVEIRASADGHIQNTIVSPGFGINFNTLQQTDRWQLAADGSYLAIETPTALFVYSPSGQLLFTRAGDYEDNGGVFAAAAQVQVVNGPGGANTAETVAVPSGVSSVSAPYQGDFQAWFADGSQFVTAAGGTVWTYSAAGVQQSAVQLSLAPGKPVGGVGNWLWSEVTDQKSYNNDLNIYAVGSTTPALTVPNFASFFASGTTLAIPGTAGFTLVDLSGAAPVESTANFTPAPGFNHDLGLPTFAAESASTWVATGESGLILDGTSLASSTPRYIGAGAALSIAGSMTNAAIATENGQVAYFDTGDTTPQGTLSLTGGKLELSTDGTVLAASALDGSLLNLYALPAGTASKSFTYPSSAPLTDFTLAGDETTLGTITPTASQVTPVSGTPVIWSSAQAPYNSIAISPDGTLIAVTNGTLAFPTQSVAVTIYKNGQQVGAVAGLAVGWIDNGRLLVNEYAVPTDQDYIAYSGCTIYRPTGTAMGTPPLPELLEIQPVTSDTIYNPARNTIYSVTTGKPTWASPYPADSANVNGRHWMGAVSGANVVFEWEGQVVSAPY